LPSERLKELIFIAQRQFYHLPVDKDRQDFTIYSGDWAASTSSAAVPTACAGSGRCTASSASLLTCAPDGHAATLEEAKARFESTGRQWLAWAKLREDT
jgi:hypothetical protein